MHAMVGCRNCKKELRKARSLKCMYSKCGARMCCHECRRDHHKAHIEGVA